MPPYCTITPRFLVGAERSRRQARLPEPSLGGAARPKPRVGSNLERCVDSGSAGVEGENDVMLAGRARTMADAWDDRRLFFFFRLGCFASVAACSFCPAYTTCAAGSFQDSIAKPFTFLL